MALTPGTRLGHYEILASLDAGGMGRVYRARDAKLGREVALKILHDKYALDPDWLGRFEREARLLAALNHHHIATIHGLDEAEGLRYLVMELVPGQTLAQRLARGPLLLDEALDVCRQIAEALEAAHERGIVHRDLKPANVKITPEGKVKVLDFGLARSVNPPPAADTPTIDYLPPTREGYIVGTPAYMAPEQARGKPVDRRCDIWALGCVLYEALTGRRPFVGETTSDILAAVIERTPAWEALPAGVPPRIGELVRRCLQKDPRKRLRDAGDVRLEIEEALAEPAASPATAAPVQVASQRRPWPFLAVATATLCAVFALGMWVQNLRDFAQEPDGQLNRRSSTGLPGDWSGQKLIGGSTHVFSPRVSPDGRWIAFGVLYDGQAELGVMKLSSGEWWVVTREKTRGFLNTFCWSPDSNRIYYDRFFDVPIGIYSAATEDRGELRGREKLVLKGAECPQVTADGSLLVCRTNSDGSSRLLKIRPPEEEEKLVLQHPVLFNSGWPPPPLRALHTRNEAIFCGKLLDGSEKSPPRRLYLLNLDTGETRVLYEGPLTYPVVPLAVARDDAHAYVVLPADDLFRVVRIPLRGEATPETVLTWPSPAYGLDFAPDGTLYIDHERLWQMEVLQFDLQVVEPERLAQLSREESFQPVLLPDQRLLVPSKVLGRDRLRLTRPHAEPISLLGEVEESRPPITQVGPDRLAVVVGPRESPQVKLISTADERTTIVKTFAEIPAAGLTTLAASPDGKELYYIHGRTVSGVAVADGHPRSLGEGDGVAVHPREKKLLVQRFEGQGVRLFWVPLQGGDRKEIKVEGPLRLAPYPVGRQAIDEKGRILAPVASREYWYWQPGLLNPDTGELSRLPLRYDGDIYPANWTRDGKILAVGFPFRSELWRLEPRSKQSPVNGKR